MSHSHKSQVPVFSTSSANNSWSSELIYSPSPTASPAGLRRNHLGTHVFDSPYRNVVVLGNSTSPRQYGWCPCGRAAGVKVQGPDKAHSPHCPRSQAPQQTSPDDMLGQQMGPSISRCRESPTTITLHFPLQGSGSAAQMLCWGELPGPPLLPEHWSYSVAASITSVSHISSNYPRSFKAVLCSGFMQNLEGSTFVSWVVW